MFKKIISIVLILITFVAVLSLTACGEPEAMIKYDSMKELQDHFPDFYYFDFDVDFEKGLVDCYVQSYERLQLSEKEEYDYDYYGYYISYGLTFRRIEERCTRYVFLTTSSNDRKKFETRGKFIDEYVIDNIKCALYRESIKPSIYSIYFSIDNVFYKIEARETFFGEKPKAEDYEEIQVDYFLSIVKPAINGRYKGVKL